MYVLYVSLSATQSIQTLDSPSLRSAIECVSLSLSLSTAYVHTYYITHPRPHVPNTHPLSFGPLLRFAGHRWCINGWINGWFNALCQQNSPPSLLLGRLPSSDVCLLVCLCLLCSVCGCATHTQSDHRRPSATTNHIIHSLLLLLLLPSPLFLLLLLLLLLLLQHLKLILTNRKIKVSGKRKGFDARPPYGSV